MSLFFGRELSRVQTSDANLDWDSSDLTTLQLGKARVVKEIEVVVNTPKGSIFKAREVGSTIYSYMFAPFEEEVPRRLEEELMSDLRTEISGIQVTRIDMQSDPIKKYLNMDVHITIQDKSYVLPIGVSARK
jgi:phage baseplate assembly protein W